MSEITIAWMAAREKALRTELFRNRMHSDRLKKAINAEPLNARLQELQRRQKDRKTELLASLGRLDLPPVICLKDVIDKLVEIEGTDPRDMHGALTKYIDSLETKEEASAA